MREEIAACLVHRNGRVHGYVRLTAVRAIYGESSL